MKLCTVAGSLELTHIMNLTFPHNFICLYIKNFFSCPFFLAFKWQHIVKYTMLSKKLFFCHDRTMHVLRVLSCRITFQIRSLISTALITEELRWDSSNGIGSSLT